MPSVRAFAPGRVNLIGDHTDHTGGLVLPMAIDLGTTVAGTAGGDEVVLRSAWSDDVVRVPLDVSDPSTVEPAWGRYVAGVVAQVRPAHGFEGSVTSTLPVGAGLSSSAALEVAVALALGFDGDAIDLALACQRAEREACGVPCGVMDQLASAAGQAGHALRIDCTTLEVTPVPLPNDLRVLVVHSGQERELTASAYAERVGACREAEATVGPLPRATVADLDAIADPVVRQRARHVVTENERVDAFVAAVEADDRRSMGELLGQSHASLRDDFEVSTPVLDELVDGLTSMPGVVGARLTGAGFGGCVVAIAEPGVAVPSGWRAWTVRASDGARRT